MQQIDITYFTSQGILPYRAQWIEFNSNPRNSYRYKVKYSHHVYSDDGFRMTGYFKVERYALQNGNWELDISYLYDSIAETSTTVDKYGSIVSETILDENGIPVPNPDAWGNEFDFMAVLFAAPVANKDIVEFYINELFDRGILDKPKNPYLT